MVGRYASAYQWELHHRFPARKKFLCVWYFDIITIDEGPSAFEHLLADKEGSGAPRIVEVAAGYHLPKELSKFNSKNQKQTYIYIYNI